jgi:hypothetical protein
MWITSPETDRIETNIRGVLAALWSVPLDSVFLQRTSGNGVGVVVYHNHPHGLRWVWGDSSELCSLGTVGILNLALERLRGELVAKADRIRQALDLCPLAEAEVK